VWKSGIGGMLNNPASVGFGWNAEAWFWKS
jgi:hypothetical protein